MNANPTEIKVEASLTQEKVDTTLTQNQDDANLQQQPKAKNLEDDPNWKALRETTKRERQKAVEAQRLLAEEKERFDKAHKEAEALKAALEAAFSKGNPIQPNLYYQEQQEETEDQRIDKKVEAKLAKMQEQAERARLEREHQEYPDKLRRDFPDFDQVISDENQDYLIYHHPEIATTLKRLPDGYDRWHDIYKMIKKFVPNSTTSKKETAKADANFSKPKSMSSTGLTQTGVVSGGSRLTEERKAENWERMERIRKGMS